MQTNAVSDRPAGEKEKGERRNERVQDVVSHEKCSSNQINEMKSLLILVCLINLYTTIQLKTGFV